MSFEIYIAGVVACLLFLYGVCIPLHDIADSLKNMRGKK